jgi:hypothetical protein
MLARLIRHIKVYRVGPRKPARIVVTPILAAEPDGAESERS